MGGGAGGEADPPLAWFVRTAYAWLAVSGLLAAFEAALTLLGGGAGALADAGRHALLFGYLGLLTAGLSGRLPTAFLDIGDAGVRASRHAYRAAYWLLLVSTICRVAAPLAGSLRTGALVLAGSAGAVGLCCLLVALTQVFRFTWRATRHAPPRLQRA